MLYVDPEHARPQPTGAKATDVTKPELGTKRICSSCSLKFYDLHKSPIVCPTCKTVFELPKVVSAKPRRPWDVPTAPVLKPAKVQAPAATVPEDAPEEDTAAASEANDENVSIDEDFEKE